MQICTNKSKIYVKKNQKYVLKKKLNMKKLNYMFYISVLKAISNYVSYLDGNFLFEG